jgi:hypothetical protein
MENENTVTLDDVYAAYEATALANAAEPYDHEAYDNAWMNAKELSHQHYGELLGREVEDIWLDCGEVWPRDRVAAWYVEQNAGDLEFEAMMLSHADHVDEVKQYWEKMLVMAARLAEADALNEGRVTHSWHQFRNEAGPARTQQQWIEKAMLDAQMSRLADYGVEVAW